MKTSKAVSCVTYNTPKFLALKLNEFMAVGKISYWCFIYHKGELVVKDITTGESKRLDDHIHCFVLPNGQINTMDFDKELLEKDKKKKTALPLKPVWWESSDWDNWYLYTSHDKDYLASKFLVKEFAYQDSDFTPSNKATFEYLTFKTRHESKLCSINNMVDYLRNGGDIGTLARNGVIKPHDAFAYKCYDDLLARGNRNPEELESGINDSF